MRAIVRIIAGLSLVLTVERDVTPKYVSTHPDEFSVAVNKDKNGLFAFEVKHRTPRPMYHVAHLTVMREGKVLAESSTPLFGRMHDNTFHFSVSPDCLAESTFDVSDSAFSGSGENVAPVPGTTIHRFRLLDFVSKKLLDGASK